MQSNADGRMKVFVNVALERQHFGIFWRAVVREDFLEAFHGPHYNAKCPSFTTWLRLATRLPYAKTPRVAMPDLVCVRRQR